MVSPEVDAAFRDLAGEAASQATRFLPDRMQDVTAPHFATLSRRLGAYLVDGLFVIPASALAWIIPFIMPGAAGVTAAGGTQLLPFLYLAVMHARSGQTVGKCIFGVRVVILENSGESHRVPGWRAAWVRAIAALGAGALLLAVGLAVRNEAGAVGAFLAASLGIIAQFWVLLDCGSAAWDPRRRALHDRVAGTVVIRAYHRSVFRDGESSDRADGAKDGA